MGEFELNEKAKTEFLNLSVIKSNFVSCWFDGQKLVMLSGQGKTLKGVVLASLEVFKSQQSKIEQLEKELGQKNKRIHDLEFYTSQFLYLLSEHQDSPLRKNLPEAQKHLHKLVDGFDLKESLRGERE